MKLESAALEEKLQKNMNRLKQIQDELMELEQGDSLTLVIELGVHTNEYRIEVLQSFSDDCSMQDMQRIDPVLRQSAIDTIHSFQQYIERLSQKTGHCVARDLGISFTQSSEFILFLNKLQSPDMDPLPGLDTNDSDDNAQEETYSKIDVVNPMRFIVVEYLPDPDDADKNCIYLIPKSPKKAKKDSTNTPILYEEYCVVNGQWMMISWLTNGFAEEEREPTQAELDSQD